MKQSPADLAIFGGPPLFADKLHVGRPNLGNREKLIQRIQEILDRNWLTNDGPCVAELESRIQQTLGCRNCIVTCNGTLALQMAIRALNLTGEVILPSFTFIATAHALMLSGIQPVFCDIDPESCNIDPQRVRERITAKTSAILGVHLWGRPCKIDELSEIAEQNRLKLLFDAAHAFHCTYRGRSIGNFGSAEVFSFHATKVLNTFEGGAVVTNDDELAGKLRRMRNFGFVDYDRVTSLGTNAKMNEVSAAMGLTSLESLDHFISVNHSNYLEYSRQLSKVKGLRILKYDDQQTCNYQYVVLLLDSGDFGLNRDDLMRILWAENVLARRYFYPGCHRMEPYRTACSDQRTFLPHTEALSEKVLLLPTGGSITREKIGQICDLIRFANLHHAEINLPPTN